MSVEQISAALQTNLTWVVVFFIGLSVVLVSFYRIYGWYYVIALLALVSAFLTQQ